MSLTATTPTAADPAGFDAFLTAYLECALWSSGEEVDEDGNPDPEGKYQSFDEWATAEDFAPEFLAQAREECLGFYRANFGWFSAWRKPDTTWDERCAHAGHDFWLTRNGHGAGFWDGDYPDEIGRALTDAAKVYGGVDLYTGEDGQIYGA